MSFEKYQPSEEELAEAENQLTPIQKIQSEAREEGYKLGAESNKNVVYAKLTTAEKSPKQEKIKHEFTLTLGNTVARPFVDFVRKEAANNNVHITLSSVPGFLEHTVKVYMEGERRDIEKMTANVKAMVESQKGRGIDNLWGR
jgi:hypothetical protein